jgi:hypothetical protein
MDKKPRIAILSGGHSLGLAAAAIMAAGHRVDLVSADALRTPELDLYPDPRRFLEHEPLRFYPEPSRYSFDGLRRETPNPRGPADPNRHAKRKAQRLARRKSR